MLSYPQPLNLETHAAKTWELKMSFGYQIRKAGLFRWIGFSHWTFESEMSWENAVVSLRSFTIRRRKSVSTK